MAKLPTVVSNLAPDLRAFVNRVREALDSGGTDRLVTVNDLIRGGIAVPGPGGTVIPPGGGVITTPPTPKNVEAEGAIQNIIVTWDDPQYFGHAYAEVWGSDTDNLGEAVQIGMAPGAIFIDAIGPSSVRYYWVRFINTLGTAGAFNAVEGVRGETGADVAYLLETLTGAITETQLYQDLGARIDLIDGLPSVAGSVNARIQAEATARADAILAEAAARGAAITTETNARQAADTSLASQITTVTAAVNGNAAAIQQEAIARADADSAEAAARQTLAARVTDTETGLTAAQASIVTESNTRATADSALSQQITALTSTVGGNTAAISTESSTRATADSALSQQITALTSTVNSNTAAISTESSTRASADSAISSQLTTLSATVGSNTTAIAQEAITRANADGMLFSQYSVKIDTNGYVSGFGLSSTANNATPFSEFIVRADRFAIAGPSVPGGAEIIPFTVTTTPQTINGVSVPVGVYMNAAYIQNGTITNAKIGNAAIDDAKITSLSAGKITAGSVSVGSYIQSSNYIIGSQGWKIHGDGTAEFAAASIRGQLTAAQINSNGLSIRNTAGTIILNAGTGNFTGSLNGTAASTVVSNASTALFTANTAQSTADSAASTASTAQSTANSALAGLTNKISNDARNVLSGSGGIAIGSLEWDSSGNRTLGFGVGITRAGIAAFNSSGGATFILNGGDGSASFSGALSAATGTFAGELSAATGTFSGSLTASAVNAVNTINIAGNAVTIPLTATGAQGVAFNTSTSVNVRTSSAYYPANTAITTIFTALKTQSGRGDINVVLNCLNSSNVLVATFAGASGGALVQTMGPSGDKVAAVFSGSYVIPYDGFFKVEAIVSNNFGDQWIADYCTIIVLGSKR